MSPDYSTLDSIISKFLTETSADKIPSVGRNLLVDASLEIRNLIAFYEPPDPIDPTVNVLKHVSAAETVQDFDHDRLRSYLWNVYTYMWSWQHDRFASLSPFTDLNESLSKTRIVKNGDYVKPEDYNNLNNSVVSIRSLFSELYDGFNLIGTVGYGADWSMPDTIPPHKVHWRLIAKGSVGKVAHMHGLDFSGTFTNHAMPSPLIGAFWCYPMIFFFVSTDSFDLNTVYVSDVGERFGNSFLIDALGFKISSWPDPNIWNMSRPFTLPVPIPFTHDAPVYLYIAAVYQNQSSNPWYELGQQYTSPVIVWHTPYYDVNLVFGSYP
jgi:hypothetical protein